VLSRIWVSDNLRACGAKSKDMETSPEHASSPLSDPQGDAQALADMSDDDNPVLERLRSRAESQRDMAHLIAGCQKSSKRKKTIRGDSSWIEKRKNTISPTLETAEECDFASDDDGSDDDFLDCEEFGLLEVPQDMISQDSLNSAPSGPEPERVALKRFVFGIEQCDVRIIGAGGAVGLELAALRHSGDSRCELNLQQLKSMRTLFDLPESWLEPRDVVPPGRETGTIFSGFSVESLIVYVEPTSGDRSELVHLEHGLKLRHRGRGEPCLLAAGPRQLLEVELKGLSLCDRGREDVEALGKALSEAVTPAPETPPAPEEAPVPICYSLEAVDVTVDVGPSFAQPNWYCSLPCLRLRNVFDDFDEVWNYTLSGFKVTRALEDPLGASVSAREPIQNSYNGSVWTSPAQPRARRTVSDMITSMEQQIEQEKLTTHSVQERASRLEEKLVEIFEMVQQLPDGPMPLALHHLLASAASGDTCKEVPALPEVDIANYELEAGGPDVRHLIEG
jgi:hypothetical protein